MTDPDDRLGGCRGFLNATAIMVLLCGTLALVARCM